MPPTNKAFYEAAVGKLYAEEAYVEVNIKCM